jgi:hypothetical protein
VYDAIAREQREAASDRKIGAEANLAASRHPSTLEASGERGYC